MTAALAPGATIGIIGGGQLGRMLAMAAARLGYLTVILEPQPDCPAAQVANAHLLAAYDDLDALTELARRCDVVTFEFENVPLEAANRLARGTTPLYPPARALEVAQDRLTEKTFLNGLGIATARFHPVDTEQEAQEALKALAGGAILKTRRLGYDGKGQARLTPDSDAAAGFRNLGGVPQIMEAQVDFDCEISIVAARDAAGRVAAFEPSRNLHRDGILRSSSLRSGVALATEDAARDIAVQILDALDYVGVIGIEFFVMPDGAVLVNEIAPRVHNSGHWTEAACAVSQFEQHIRAICGLPLGSPFRHSDCVMENLIGDDIARCTQLLAERGVLVHLYGKAETRPGRKMGHFTRLLAR